MMMAMNHAGMAAGEAAAGDPAARAGVRDLRVRDLLLPVLVLIVAKFVGPMKRNPQIVYGVCVVLVLIVCLLTVTGSGGNWMPSSISAALAVLVLWWSYTRDTRKATPSSPPTP